MGRKLPEGVTPREEIPPNQRGFPTIRISDAVKGRLDAYRGKRSYAEAVGALLDAVEAQSVPSVPVESLSPVSDALHELERKVQGGRFHSPEELVKAIREVRRQLESIS